jgi:Cu+-exporting ATPase
LARDPVCGMVVDEKRAKSSSEHGGKAYFFCSSQCKETFDSDPLIFILE